MEHMRIVTVRAFVLFASSADNRAARRGPSRRPPPPADWGPMSINLEDVPYPHPVTYLPFTLEGQDVRMAYMDVAPLGHAERQVASSCCTA